MNCYITKLLLIGLGLFSNVCCHGDGEKPGHEIHHHHIFQRSYSGDNWLENLFYNLVAYMMLIVPAFLFIRYAKKSAQSFNQGNSGLYNSLVRCCVLGKNSLEDTVVNSNNATQLSNSKVAEETVLVYSLKLLACIIGLQTSYLTWGILQERIMTRTYGDDKVKFTDSQFLVFMNRVLAFVISGLYIATQRRPFPNMPFYKYAFSSISNILSSWCQYEALKFVSFPTQVLGKTSKMIPVMLMGKLISKKTYQMYEYIVALGISLGVSTFLLSVGKGKHTSAETTAAGVLLMLGYMTFDSFTSNWQSELFQSYKLSSMQMMFGVNTFSSLFTFVSLVQTGGLIKSFIFMYTTPEFAIHAIMISCMSATGQLFIFYTISKFGPLVFTTIMVTRQTLSILLSCIIYNHTLTSTAVVGVLIVFVSLFLQIYAKWRIRKLKQNTQQTPV